LWERTGGDGAALPSLAALSPRWKNSAAVDDDDPQLCRLVQPESVEHAISAEQARVAALPGDSTAVGDRARLAQAVASAYDREAPQRGWDRQAHRRWEEGELRKRSIAFCHELRAGNWSTAETAKALGLSPRTLRHWDHCWETDRLAPLRRGRPPRIASIERRADVAGFLKAHGPSISIAALQAEYPDLARAELAALRADFRAEWQREHAREQCRLEWLCPRERVGDGFHSFTPPDRRRLPCDPQRA
jgi:hypothetical protein